MTRTAPRLAAAALVGLTFLGAFTARGHIVYGRPTLLSLVGGAKLVAHVRVVDPQAVAEIEPGKRRPVVEVEIREVLKGRGSPGERLRFATHGHGVAAYEHGEEAIVFLVPIEASRELDEMGEAGVRWVSFQEHDARYVLDAAGGPALLRAVRAYVSAERIAEPARRVEALRAVTRELILSGDERLAAGAVQDAATTEGPPLLTADDVPLLLERVVRAPGRPTEVRAAVLTVLTRRRLVDGPPLWVELLSSTEGPERLQVIRAAGRHPSPQVDAVLAKMLGGEDVEVAEAAALALAGPGHETSVGPLARALEHPALRVRMAAVRALGGIGSDAALAALTAASETNADPALRRRAAAEVRKRTR